MDLVYLEERFWPKVRGGDVETCWQWTAGVHHTGYGHFGVRERVDGALRYRTDSAHRVAYMALVGPAPAGLVLDHLCRNRLCVNPWHLEPVTSRENTLRGATVAARNAARATCKHGHPLTTRVRRDRTAGVRRICKTCEAKSQRAYAERRRSA